MAPCKIDATGVGTYDSQGWIEAENYMKLTGPAAKVHLGSSIAAGDEFGVTMRDGGSIDFPHITGLTAVQTQNSVPVKASIRFMCPTAPVSGAIEVVARSDGRTIAICHPPYTNWCSLHPSWKQHALNSGGELELALRYKGHSQGRSTQITVDKFSLRFTTA